MSTVLHRSASAKSWRLFYLQSSIINCDHYSVISAEALKSAKPYGEIPGPKPLPFLGNLYRYMPVIGDWSFLKFHECQWDKYRRWGKIVREDGLRGGHRMVHLYDPEDMANVYLNDQKYVNRGSQAVMAAVRQEKPDLYPTLGINATQGEEWFYHRSLGQKILMRQHLVREYLPHIDEVATEFVDRMDKLRSSSGVIPEFYDELNKWAFETIIYVLANQRMGSLSSSAAEDVLALVRSLEMFFKGLFGAEFSFPVWKHFPNLSRHYKKCRAGHEAFFKGIYDIISKAQKAEGSKAFSADSVYNILLKNTPPKDATMMVIDLAFAAIETNTTQLSHLFRFLAKDGDLQRRIQKELEQHLQPGQPVTQSVLDKAKLLRASLKESMRLGPITHGVFRILPQDTVLSGYRVPKGTQVVLNHFVSSKDGKLFPDPEKFLPERWIRSKDEDDDNEEVSAPSPSGVTLAYRFAFMPFGYGPRACIGKKLAELEMLTLSARILERFDISYPYKEPFELESQLVFRIKTPLNFQFTPRKGKI